MPRITSRRVETPALQGEGSYVVFRRLSYGAVKQARRFQLIGNVKTRSDLTVEQIDAMMQEEEELTIKFVAEGILDWNWQDDSGKPLPLPKTAKDLDNLNIEEVAFIIQGCTGQLPGQAADDLTRVEAKN